MVIMISVSDISETGLAALRFSDSESDDVIVSDDDGADDDADAFVQYASSETRCGVIILLTNRFDGLASASEESDEVSEICVGFVTTNC